MLVNLGAGLVAPIFDSGRLNSARDLVITETGIGADLSFHRDQCVI